MNLAVLELVIGGAQNQTMNILRLPDLGASTGEAEVVVWLKAVGESITVGEPVLEVQSDKANVEVEATISGTLARVLAEEGQITKAGRSSGGDRGARRAARRRSHRPRACRA